MTNDIQKMHATQPDLGVTREDILDCFTVCEVGIHYKRTFDLTARPKVKGAKHTAEILRAVWDDDTLDLFETTYALFMSQGSNILHIAKLCDGTGNGCVMDARKILQIALNVNALSVIIAHNHPSGQLFPSVKDINVTKQVYEACKAMNMALLDHVILTRDSYFAFSESVDHSKYLYS